MTRTPHAAPGEDASGHPLRLAAAPVSTQSTPSCSWKRTLGRLPGALGRVVTALGLALVALPGTVLTSALSTPADAAQLRDGTPLQAAGGGAGQDHAEPRGVELSVLDAVELALRHNLDVRVSRFDQDVSEERITAARAPFDPMLTFDIPSALRRDTSPQATQLGGADVLTNEALQGGVQFSETFEWGTSWSLAWNARRSVTNNTFSTFNPQLSSDLSLNVQQPLLRDFGRRVNTAGIEVARSDHAASIEQFRAEVQAVVFQTYQAYWELVFAAEDLEVKRLDLELAHEQLERNRAQVEIGTLAPIETVQAEQAVASAEFQLAQAAVALDNAQDRLKELLNAEASLGAWQVRIVPTDEPAEDVGEVDEAGALAVALDNDPQLRQLGLAAEGRRIELDAARNGLLPSLDLTGNFSLSGLGGDRIIRAGFLGGAATEIQEGGFGNAVEQLFSGDFHNWSVGLTLQMPLHNWQARARHAQASVQERQALERIEQRELAVKVAVLRAARALETGAEQVALARKARQLAERQLDAEERKFAVGTTTNFQVLQLQRELSAARTQELRAILDLNVARASFEQAKGTLLEALGVSLREAGRG